jgi:tRNA (guanine-N7-)-methyltransferase
MFSEQGIPIKALIARKGPDSSVTWVEPKELARRLEPEEESDPAGEVQE